MDAVLNWVWQGVVVGVACSFMLLVLKRARANVRYMVCWATALLVMGLPLLPFLVVARATAASLPSPSPAAIVSLPDGWWTSVLVVLAAWVLWASLHAVRFAAAILAIRRARAGSRPFPSGVESALAHWRRVSDGGRRATLVVSDAVPTAAVLGCGAPMIAVAPSLVSTLDAGELDRVLIHEWAHVQRRDDLVNLLQIVVRVVAGWHPVIWWLDTRLHVEREIACDETTVAITGSPKAYAACLMKLAGLRATSRALQTAPSALTTSGLRARVIKIVSPHRSLPPAWSRGIAAAMVTTLCLLSARLGGMDLVEATAVVLPTVSPRVLATLGRPAAPSVATAMPHDMAKRASRRTVRRADPAQHVDAERPALLPVRETQLVSIPAIAAAIAVAPPAAADADDQLAVQPADVPAAPSEPPVQASALSTGPRTPWSAAAAGGVAVGRKSKDASVATAGFFTRAARRIAGSF